MPQFCSGKIDNSRLWQRDNLGYAQPMSEPRWLTGQFLLAMPGMGDPRFDHAVIAVCSHDEGGALGIGVGNQFAGAGLHKLLAQFEIEPDGVVDAPLHCGGPVEPQRGFVLHSLDWGGQGTVDVAGRWGLTSTVDALRVIGRAHGPRDWLVALGYAGWSAGQLDNELTRPGWHVTPASAALMFATPVAERWGEAFRGGGIDPRLLSHQSGRA